MKSPVLIAGVVLTLACTLLYVYEPPLITTLSHRAYDSLLKARHDPPRSDRVVIVDLDEASFAEFGQWPWPRYVVADLTKRILDAGASVVAFDIVFSEPDRTSPRQLVRDMRDHLQLDVGFPTVPEGYQDFDELFAQTLSQGRVALGCWMRPLKEAGSDVVPEEDPTYRGWFYSKGSGNLAEHLFQAEAVTLAIPSLREAAGNSAFFNTVPHGDTIVRDYPLIWAYGPNRIYPALALEAVRLDKGTRQAGIVYDAKLGVTSIRLDDLAIPTDAKGRLLVNHRESKKAADGARYVSFPSYSAAAVLTDTVSPAELKDKIVLVGTSAAGLHDLRATPLASPIAGVEIHAAAIDNLLAGDFLSSPPGLPFFDVAAIILVCLALTLVTHKGRSWLSFTVALSAIAASLAISYAMFAYLHLVFTPVRLIVSIAVTSPTLAMISFWQHERRERWIRNSFGSMVSDKVLTYLESSPDSLTLKGRRAEATILFSDIKGFSRIAEDIDADRLSDLLNQYLSPMTEIIRARDGYVDKYIGDMIMAEWGVPYAMPHHAREACMSALEMVERLRHLQPELLRQFGHELHVRVGINSGLVAAGNMGSDKRFWYSVMGDAVNLAARLEPLNKEYGTAVIIGKTTHMETRDEFETRLLDRVLVAGKSRPEEIYELLAIKGGLQPREVQGIATYEEALRAYWSQDWVRALAALHEALALCPKDPPSVKLLEHVTRCRTSPELAGDVRAFVKEEPPIATRV